MLKKRLIGVITVKAGWAVQSFSYHSYLPLGKPEWLAQNLDRWQVDEILIQVIDRSENQLGPDFQLIEKLGKLGLETPLIYSGGIRSVEDAVKVIQIGADRIMVDTLLYDNLDIVRDIAKELGAQAVIASLPLCWKNFEIKWLNYRSRDKALISNRVLELLKSGSVSEVLITDCEHEGVHNSFEVKLIEEFPLKDVSIIVFGGISNSAQMRTLLNFNAIVAIAIGNFLTYHEHAVQKYKEALIGCPLRQASYKSIFN